VRSNFVDVISDVVESALDAPVAAAGSAGKSQD
jgi:hypothetical protein